MSKNFIKLKGIVDTVPTLSHKLGDIEFYKFNLKVITDYGKEYILPVVDRNYLISNQYKKDDFIEVEGKIYTYSVNNEGKRRTSVEVHAFKADFVENIDDRVFVNEVELSGAICSNYLKETKNSKFIGNSKLAVERDNKKKFDYIPIVLWNEQAKEINSYEVGTVVNIEGFLQSREYTKDEKTHTVIEVNTTQLKKLD